MYQTNNNIPFPTQISLKGNLNANCKRFFRVWENYEIATGLIFFDDMELRTATFLTCVGLDALEKREGFKFLETENNKDLPTVIKKVRRFPLGMLPIRLEMHRIEETEYSLLTCIDVC